MQPRPLRSVSSSRGRSSACVGVLASSHGDTGHTGSGEHSPVLRSRGQGFAPGLWVDTAQPRAAGIPEARLGPVAVSLRPSVLAGLAPSQHTCIWRFWRRRLTKAAVCACVRGVRAAGRGCARHPAHADPDLDPDPDRKVSVATGWRRARLPLQY